MPVPPFQSRVSQFVIENNLEITVGDRMLDLASEVGELAKEILKASKYGRDDFQPNDAWSDELGDVFFSLICLANSTDTNLLTALDKALDKYQARLNKNSDAGSKTI